MKTPWKENGFIFVKNKSFQISLIQVTETLKTDRSAVELKKEIDIMILEKSLKFFQTNNQIPDSSCSYSRLGISNTFNIFISFDIHNLSMLVDIISCTLQIRKLTKWKINILLLMYILNLFFSNKSILNLYTNLSHFPSKHNKI